MDVKKIGGFIARLRHEKGLTQQELGERLGVTNKTVSRWENGNYMPDISILQLLGKEFDVTINELLCGERLTDAEYREMAEENIVKICSSSVFTLRERCLFFKKKWCRDHRFLLIVTALLLTALLIFGFVYKSLLLIAGVLLMMLVIYLLYYNRMMAYVERNAYDGTGSTP